MYSVMLTRPDHSRPRPRPRINTTACTDRLTECRQRRTMMSAMTPIQTPTSIPTTTTLTTPAEYNRHDAHLPSPDYDHSKHINVRLFFFRNCLLLLTYLLHYSEGRATIPLGSNLGQVVYTHSLPSFSAPRNWGTKGSFRRLSGYGD